MFDVVGCLVCFDCLGWFFCSCWVLGWLCWFVVILFTCDLFIFITMVGCLVLLVGLFWFGFNWIECWINDGVCLCCYGFVDFVCVVGVLGFGGCWCDCCFVWSLLVVFVWVVCLF